MKLNTTKFSEHQTSAKQDILALDPAGAQMVAPGACTSCNGSTCCSCCGVFSPNGGNFRDDDEG